MRILPLWLGIVLAAAGLNARSAQAQCAAPGVLLIQDRSISMRTGSIDNMTKWAIAEAAIGNLLDAHGDAARFGLMLYPGPSGLGAAGVNGPVGACDWNGNDAGCEPLAPRCSTGEVVVDVGNNTAGAIRAALAWPDGLRHSYTPTWQSVVAAANYPGIHRPGQEDYAILITDGYQCCGLFQNADGSLGCEAEDRQLLIGAVQTLVDSGVTPFIVGFGGLVDVEALQRAAVTAGTSRPGCDPAERNVNAQNHCYYQADNQAELNQMLQDIVRQIREEQCDGRDNDCDGAIDEGLSRPCQTDCGRGEESCFNGRWGNCDVPAAQAEICNGRDDDCDGLVDDMLARGCNTVCGQGSETCEGGAWVGCDAPLPGDEICGNGADDDCDGAIDEGCDCTPGEIRACGDEIGACEAGTQTCSGAGRWGDCDGGVGPAAEICDGIDNDCDGTVDGLREGCQTACGNGQRLCQAGQWGECDAPEAQEEICDGTDNDCDGAVDEEVSRPCQTPCGDGVEWCQAGAWGACSGPMPAAEICGNGADDDCDGSIDEGCECEDGERQPCGSDEGPCQVGEQLCQGGAWGDCMGAVDGTAELCNGVDDDCDGVIDDGDLCEGDQVCGCGACADPCEANECGGEAACIFGHCISDNCPNGFVCVEGACVAGDGDGGAGGDDNSLSRFDAGAGGDGRTGASDGCACDTGGGKGSGAAGLLVLLLGAALRRRGR